MAKRPIDAVRTANSIYSLETDQRIEALTYTGTSNFKGTGNRSDNVITGNIGNDTLDGLTGADTLIGGKGDDIYVVDDAGDVITEKVDEGTDEAQTKLSTYSIGAFSNVENLTYTGTSAFHGTGNGLANFIKGGAGKDRLDGLGGNDTLDGGAGADTMIGGMGDDTYVVDSLSDVVTELGGEGIDTIEIEAVTLDLGSVIYTELSLENFFNVENLTYTGSYKILGTGNDLNNVIIGGDHDDWLDGGSGADTLIGGYGRDTYWVDNINDMVIEHEGQGIDDWINVTFPTYNLADLPNVECLGYTGEGNFLGYGTDSNNGLSGAEGNDTLVGKGGDDFLVGRDGNDSIVAGDGNDLVWSNDFYFGNDTVLGGGGNDFLFGGGDDDLLWGDDSDGDRGNDTLQGADGNDTVFGMAGNDVLFGDLIRNNLSKLDGNDLLQGGRGSDSLNGGNGDDRLESANGMGGDESDVDSMYGGLGTDTYVYQAGGTAIIEDFKDGETLILSFRDVLVTSNIHVAYDDTTKDSTITFDGYDSTLNAVVMWDFDATMLDVSVYGADLMLA